MLTIKRHYIDTVEEALIHAPEEAPTIALRAELLAAIRTGVESWRLPPAEAAHRLAISRGKLDAILKNRINMFSLDTLVMLAPRVGVEVRMEVTRR